MLEVVATTVFMMGLLGGVHCASMCGGILIALSQAKAQPLQPIYFYRSTFRVVWEHIPYHLGRIISYALLGAVMARVSPFFWHEHSPSKWVYILMNSMLMMIGVQWVLKGIWQRFFARFDALFFSVFRLFQPWIARLMRWDSTSNTRWSQVVLGLVWGFMPCGMVYSALALAALTGRAYSGAAVMLAFGIGTLPNLLLIGSMLKSLRQLMSRVWVPRMAGVLLIGFSFLGFLRVGMGLDPMQAVLGCFHR